MRLRREADRQGGAGKKRVMGLEPEFLPGVVGEPEEGALEVVVFEGDPDGSAGASGFAGDLFDGFSGEELVSEVVAVAEFGVVGPHGVSTPPVGG